MSTATTIEIPKLLESSIILEEDGQIYTYVGTVEKLKFYGINSIFCLCKLSKIRANGELVWSISSSSTGSCLSAIILNGHLVDIDREYKSDIRGMLANSGILVSKYFIQQIFNPIEEQLLKLQKIVEGF